MKKILIVVLLLTLFTPAATAPVLAEGAGQTAVTDAGNKRCPVMGGPVSGSDFVEYNGKRYGLCCSGCQKAFLMNPKKYAAIAEAETQPTAPASTATVTPILPESSGMETQES